MSDIEVYKRVIRDYLDLKEKIEILVANDGDWENLKVFIRSLENVSIIREETSYVDFNYKDMTLTISNFNALGLENSIEVWDDKKCEYLGYFYNIQEILQLINKEV